MEEKSDIYGNYVALCVEDEGRACQRREHKTGDQNINQITFLLKIKTILL